MDNKEIFYSFVGDTRYAHPWLNNNYIIATNGHILIKCPVGLVDRVSDVVPDMDYIGVPFKNVERVCKPTTPFERFDVLTILPALETVLPQFTRALEEEATFRLRDFEIPTRVKFRGGLYNWHYLRLFFDIFINFSDKWEIASGEGAEFLFFRSDNGVTMALMGMLG